MALNKAEAKDDPYKTLQEALEAKKRKYSSLGSTFYPIVLSAGGLIALETAKTYKSF